MARHDVFFLKRNGTRYVDFEYFIARSRYLLTIVQDAHLADLFMYRHMDAQVEPKAYLCHGYENVVASWIAGLQKNRLFSEAISKLIVEQSARFGGSTACSWHAAAVLLGEPGFHVPLRQACLPGIPYETKNQPGMYDSNRARFLALAALQMLDERLGTNYAEDLTAEAPPGATSRARFRIQRILDVSAIVRCGVDFTTPDELRAGIETFIATATPMVFQVYGVLSPPTIRDYTPWSFDGEAHVKTKAQFKEHYAWYSDLGLTMPQHFVNAFPEPQIWHELPRRRRDTFLLRHVYTWLTAERPDDFWLRVAARSAESAFDIVAALEMDVNNRLPVDVVDMLYEKLTMITKFDAAMYRQYAYDLLLRSTSHDAKANELLLIAKGIESRQQRVEGCSHLHMPTGAYAPALYWQRD